MTTNHDMIRKLIGSLLAVATLLAAMLGLALPSRAATITVAAGVVEIDGADGQCALIEAIVNANDDAATHPDCPAGNGADVIELASGAFYAAANNNYGGTALPAITDELTIEGNNSTLAETAAGSFRLMNNGVGNPLTIRDLTIEDGGAHGPGGAIYNNGHLTINNGTFRGNDTVTTGGGGAIYLANADSSLTVINSTFENNGAIGDGGAIYAAGGGPVRIFNSTFTNNGTGNTTLGGAVYVDGSNGARLEIRGSTFTDNSIGAITTSHKGGAVYVRSAAAGSYIAYTTFDGNEAYGGGAMDIASSPDFLLDHVTATNNVAGAAGGALSGSDVEIIFSTFQGNSANYGGAINVSGLMTVHQTAFLGNSATQDGGAVNISTNIFATTPLTIKYSEISENTAGGSGGGIRIEGNGDVTLSHSTISGNRADQKAGGIHVFGSSSYPVVLQSSYNSIVSNSAGAGAGGFYLQSDSEIIMRNTVLMDNTSDVPASYSSTCDSYGTFTSGDYNRYPASANSGCSSLFTAANDASMSGPTGNIDLTLQNNGGRTRTHAIISGGDLHNQIPDGVNGCVAGVKLDQRGYVRAGGGGAGGSQCDVGAYELNAVCSTPVAPAASIAASAADVVISWTQPAENDSTELWRSTDPYFAPTSPGNKTPHNTLNETYTFYGDVGDASDNNRYYAIRGLAGCGTESVAVARTGEFDFALTPGAP